MTNQATSKSTGDRWTHWDTFGKCWRRSRGFKWRRKEFFHHFLCIFMGNLPLSSKVDFPWNFTKMMGNCFLRRFNLLERLQHFQNVSQRVPRPQFDLEVDWFVTKDLSNQHFPKNICFFEIMKPILQPNYRGVRDNFLKNTVRIFTKKLETLGPIIGGFSTTKVPKKLPL